MKARVVLGAFCLPDESFYSVPLLVGNLTQTEKGNFMWFLHIFKAWYLSC